MEERIFAFANRTLPSLDLCSCIARSIKNADAHKPIRGCGCEEVSEVIFFSQCFDFVFANLTPIFICNGRGALPKNNESTADSLLRHVFNVNTHYSVRESKGVLEMSKLE